MIAISTTLAFTPWAVFGLVEGSHFAGTSKARPYREGTADDQNTDPQ
jgi:hypothetical protein